MLVAGLDVGLCAEVDLDDLAHDGFAVEDLLNADGGVGVKEGNDDAGEGLEGCPGVDWGGGIDEVFDGLEVISAEDFFVLEVGDYEGVRWRGRHREGR